MFVSEQLRACETIKVPTKLDKLETKLLLFVMGQHGSNELAEKRVALASKRCYNNVFL